MDSYKDLLPQATLRFIPFCLSLNDLNHCQRVHKLHRGYKFRSPGFVLGELEDEHDLHGDVWFSVLQRAVGNRLRDNPSSAFRTSANTFQARAMTDVTYVHGDGARVIYGVEDLELQHC